MRNLFILFSLFLVQSCVLVDNKKPEPLPILGERLIEGGDTIFHTIPDFSFINQDSQVVNNETFAGKLYVADFFFISCPTICPTVTKQMLRIHDHFQDEDRVLLLAHSIDPKRDTVGRLANYATNLGVNSQKWHFVTGEKDNIFEIADDYFSIAIESPDAPGGFDHSGRLILVDENRYVRSFCDGTDPESVGQFIKDIELLLQE
ncbi:MAG: SCO family protein [Saprospiraceae bacterium]|nr:SCO family protein [Saprospiraceae bacterium]